MDDLPTDIIIDILSRLPVKTLSKLRCVSTLWRALISSPHFLSTHHNRATREPLLLFSKLSNKQENDGSHTIHLTSVDQQGRVLKTFTNKVKITDYMDSSHGCVDLVCLAGSDCIYVCNPSTEEFMTLTPQASHWTNHPIYAVGLGYSSSSNAYKVVHLFTYYLSGNEISHHGLGCEVFSLGCADSSWRRVEDCPYMVLGLWTPPFVEGSLHWPIISYSDDEQAIVSFNVDREDFRVILLPEFCSSFKYLSLVELGRCLCLLGHIQPLKFNIWMLKDYENQIWVKEYALDLPAADIPYFFPNPRAIRGDGTILLETHYGSFDYYDPKTGTYKADGIKVEGMLQFSYYVESFYSLGNR